MSLNSCYLSDERSISRGVERRVACSFRVVGHMRKLLELELGCSGNKAENRPHKTQRSRSGSSVQVEDSPDSHCFFVSHLHSGSNQSSMQCCWNDHSMTWQANLAWPATKHNSSQVRNLPRALPAQRAVPCWALPAANWAKKIMPPSKARGPKRA
jgi:hypothetical protein